jgi:hypothetical protein
VSRTSYSPSKIDTFERCQRRFWFDERLERRERMRTDETLGSVGRAVHETIMLAVRWVDSQLKRGNELTGSEVVTAMENRLVTSLRTVRADPSDERVARRLEMLRPGFRRTLSEMPAQLADFVVDPGSGDRLVWSEQFLDSGARGTGVRLGDAEYSVTRADLVGLIEGDAYVLDFKTGRSVVDPLFDTGVLVRACWALQEAEGPAAPWFIAGRTDIAINASGVTLAVANLLHHESEDFRVERYLSAARIKQEGARLAATIREMATIVASDEPATAVASPGPLCHGYCPWLHRCGDGQDHVRKYHGRDALKERLEGSVESAAWDDDEERGW